MTARIAGGIGLVGCAAIVAVTMGGSGLFGGLGSLFGRGSEGPSLQVAKAQQQDADIVAAPETRAARARVLVAPTPRTVPRQKARHKPATPIRRTAETPAPPASPVPAVGPQPPKPPAPPSPGGGRVVTTVTQAVDQIVEQAPPEARTITQPVIDAVDTLGRTCLTLPACP